MYILYNEIQASKCFTILLSAYLGLQNAETHGNTQLISNNQTVIMYSNLMYDLSCSDNIYIREPF